MAPLASRVWSRLKRSVVQTPIFSLNQCEMLIRRKTIGLCYHSISARPLKHIAHLYPQPKPSVFEEHLVALKKLWPVLTYEDLSKMRSSGGQHPGVFVSFDDGLRECFDVVRPLLLKHGVPCTFFITTDLLENTRMLYRHKASLCWESISELDESVLRKVLNARVFVTNRVRTKVEAQKFLFSRAATQEMDIDSACDAVGVRVGSYLRSERPYMTWPEVRMLAAEGFTIGAHGKSHRLIGGIAGHEEREEEILGSARIIREVTRQKEIPFAFPFSGDGIDRDWLEGLRSRNPDLGLFFDLHGLKTDRSGAVLNRIWCESKLFNPNAVCGIDRIVRRAYQAHMLEVLSARYQD